MFDTVLVANRGEIAVRVIRTLRRLGVRSVAVYSDADAASPHVALADVAVRIGPAAAAQSYLSIPAVIEAARATGAQAIHPGYGFLSENTAFAAACEEAGIVFVGPPASAIEAMGDKIRAKQTVAKAGVPVVPGSDGAGLDDAALALAVEQVGYPVLLKPSAGGGGKGMHEVHRVEDLAAAIATARREARSSFGDDTLLVERLVTTPRHIEIQVLADQHGNVVHLGERECSLQRRHQKIVEEAPSALLTDTQRDAMGAAAVEAARAVGYTGAGTVEFIVGADDPDQFFFMEMNTRLQVEHPVTEEVYGVDLVESQLRVAAGETAPWPERLAPSGHAVEVRIYAETVSFIDGVAVFLPTGGRILACEFPDGVRVDSGIAEGGTVGSDYDPMLAKIIAHGTDRAEALRRLDAALRDTVVLGLGTNIGFLRALLADDDVRAGRLDTGLVGRRVDGWVASGPDGVATPSASAGRHRDRPIGTSAVASAASPEAGSRRSGRPGTSSGSATGDPAVATAALPDDVLAAAAAHALLHLEPAGAVVDPFDIPGGWRIGEPAWTTWRMVVSGHDPVDVRIRGRAAAAEVVVGDGEPQPVAARTQTPTRAHGNPDSRGLGVTYRGVSRSYHCVQDGDTLWIGRDGFAWGVREQPPLEAAATAEVGTGGPVLSPMPGTVTVVEVTEGQRVAAGDRLIVVEAMKMEHVLTAPVDGTVRQLRARAGATVARDAALLIIDGDEDGS